MENKDPQTAVNLGRVTASQLAAGIYRGDSPAVATPSSVRHSPAMGRSARSRPVSSRVQGRSIACTDRGWPTGSSARSRRWLRCGTPTGSRRPSRSPVLSRSSPSLSWPAATPGSWYWPGPSVAIFSGLAVIRIAAHWSWLVYGLAAADLLIPEDNRYVLHGSGGLGFQLQPYRLIVTIVVIGWIAALMVDPRVRARKTGFDGPLILIWCAIIGSEAFNPGRASPLESTVLKQLILMVSLTLFVYAFVSVIRTRATIERLLAVLVSCGLVVAVAALVERATKYNVFNHLHKFLPMFQFDSTAELLSLLRNGHFRAIASAGHPIELANDMAMLTPWRSTSPSGRTKNGGQPSPFCCSATCALGRGPGSSA